MISSMEISKKCTSGEEIHSKLENTCECPYFRTSLIRETDHLKRILFFSFQCLATILYAITRLPLQIAYIHFNLQAFLKVLYIPGPPREPSERLKQTGSRKHVQYV